MFNLLYIQASSNKGTPPFIIPVHSVCRAHHPTPEFFALKESEAMQGQITTDRQPW
jgi:hypothetical protein